MLMVVMSNSACAAGKKGSGVEGKVVGVDGKPLAGIKVVATQKEPLKGYEKVEVKTKSDGSFSLKGLYPESEYVIAPDVADSCNKEGSKVGIRSAPVGEIKPLKENIVVKRSLLRVSKEGVITDPVTNLEWAPDPGNQMSWNQATQYVQSLSLAGGGWRLPTIQELRTIYDISCDNTIAHPAFNFGWRFAWLSRGDGASGTSVFNFDNGKEVSGYSDFIGRVLAVRSRK